MLLLPLRMLAVSSAAVLLLPMRGRALMPLPAAAPADIHARLLALLLRLCTGGPPAAAPDAAARLLQLPAWLLGALPLPLSLLLALAGSTRPGTIASATLPSARLLGLNLTTRRLLPVRAGTSFSCSFKCVWWDKD
jgi:hypothetical protein